MFYNLTSFTPTIQKENRMTRRNISYIEIPTRDVTESGKFYEALFGWKITPMPDEMNYSLWDPGEGPTGGFNPVNDEFKAGDVSISVNSDDIEADLAKAVSLGGSILYGKTEIPGHGWYGMFKDPTGNRISLYTTLNK
jgi:predicted enzyme related to lactoylglutathione lyase